MHCGEMTSADGERICDQQNSSQACEVCKLRTLVGYFGGNSIYLSSLRGTRYLGFAIIFLGQVDGY